MISTGWRTCSSVVKGEVARFVFVLFAIVTSAAAEELLPSFLGSGVPLLLALVLVLSPRLDVLSGVISAAGAGAFEDALASLPPMTSVSFFVVAALLSRVGYFPRAFLVLVFPAFGLWAWMCAVGPIGDVFVGVLASLPLGAAAVAVLHLVLAWAGGKAGLDE